MYFFISLSNVLQFQCTGFCSLILSHLKIKLAYYSFIGASRRHETPASETKDFITHNTVSSINISMFVSASLASTSHESDVQLHI